MPIEELAVDKERVSSLFKTCAPLFLALGDNVRQDIILDIADADNDGVNINYLTERTKLSRPAVVYHLKILKDCGLVRTEKKGALVYYFLGLEDKINTISESITLLKTLILEKKKLRMKDLRKC